MSSKHAHLTPAPVPCNEIGLAAPDIREEDIARVVETLRSGNLVQGRRVAELEEQFLLITGRRHAIAVSSGTAALHLSLLARGIGPGDEVIVPAFSFVATGNAVVMTGATPVFIDILPQQFTWDSSLLEDAITSRTRLLMPVHEFGMIREMDAVRGRAEAAGLPVIEDAACALGSTWNGRPAGGFGSCAAFSLHPRKVATSGEGGVVVCDDDALADAVRELRNHGMAPGGGRAEPTFPRAGLNCRLTDIQAALAIGQVTRLPETLARRREIAGRYLAELRRDVFVLPEVPDGCEPNWQTFHVLLADDMDRSMVISRLGEMGIRTNLGAQCIPAQEFYCSTYGFDAPRQFPNAWKAWKQGLAIPLHEKLTDEHVEWIIRALNTLNR